MEKLQSDLEEHEGSEEARKEWLSSKLFEKNRLCENSKSDRGALAEAAIRAVQGVSSLQPQRSREPKENWRIYQNLKSQHDGDDEDDNHDDAVGLSLV